MNPMLCLDIDGVLNNWTSGGEVMTDTDDKPVSNFIPHSGLRPRIDKANAEALEHILSAVGCVEIVFSSSWRKVVSIEHMTKWLRTHGVPSANIVARTCMERDGGCNGHSRGEHILATMQRMQMRSGPRAWCALDDDPSIILPGIPHVHTDADIGLTMTDAARAIALLKVRAP